MIASPRLLETEALHVAFIHLQVSRSEIQEVMAPALEEIMAAIIDQGLEIPSPWLTHHRKMLPDAFDVEICVPTHNPIKPVGRVQSGELRAALVAQTVYQGDYEGLGEAWSTFMDWISEQGHVPAPDLWERYLSGPDSSDNPDDWRTELNRPLLSIAGQG